MNIVLGVTGGIAAYKSVLLARLLVEAGHEVHVVPTDDALKFVGRPTWEAISRHPVTTSVHDNVPEVRHVALGQQADLVIIAPATANTLARMRLGLADDLLGTTLLATTAPVLVAPAMHTEMWAHPSTQENMRVLRERGVHVVGPESGRLTGSDSGPGRMSEPDAIYAAAEQLISGGSRGSYTPAPAAGSTLPSTADYAGMHVVVSAGGTREPIDPVRFIGNRSSGKQGIAVVVAAARRGATRVTLIAANIESVLLTEARTLPAIEIVEVGTADELQRAAEQAVTAADVIVMAAAVSDYRVDQVADVKIRKEDSEAPVLRLVENPDILAGLVQRRRPGQTFVAFAAETMEPNADDPEAALIERGVRKLARKGADLLALNEVGWEAGFGTEHNTLRFITRDGVTDAVTGSKHETAEALLDAVLAQRG